MTGLKSYIGLPWEAGAAGPESWDCMAFVREVQGRYFGVAMPAITIPDYDDKRMLVGMVNSHVENEHWRPVPSPAHGDLVLVRSPVHYGIYLDVDGGGVLHCVRGQGVVWTKNTSWALSGFGRRQYLRHVSKA